MTMSVTGYPFDGYDGSDESFEALMDEGDRVKAADERRRVERLDELHRQRNVELAKNSAERQEIWDRFTAAEAALSINRTEVGA